MREAAVAAVRGRIRLTSRGAVLAVIITALLLYLVVPLRTYIDQRNQLSDLQQQTALLEEQNRVLQRQVALLHDPAYLERLARECLGMVRPGEIGFVVVPKEGQALPSSC
ncbi:MAG: septum formation initiator family protein [Actinomycetota bacterium]|nr:septum formation initiator family protein [Actinomycetota bacterium]